MLIIPGGSLLWFSISLTQSQLRCKTSHINIHHMPPNKVSRAWICQQVVWLPGRTDNCLPHVVWKIPPFSGEIYEGGSVPLSSQQPLWSHSPLVDCLPNGHWQMGLKIASLAPLPQTPTVVGQHAAAFPSLNFSPLVIFFILWVFQALQYCTFIFPLAPFLLLLFLLFNSPFVWTEGDKVCSFAHLIIASWHFSRHCVKPL